jgi:ATP-dependent Clp protease ATP-binding subunit ClpB
LGIIPSEGLSAGLIDRSGGRSREALAGVEKALGALPKVSGSGAGQVYLTPALARVFDQRATQASKNHRPPYPSNTS